jgi:hypothetical protein
MASFDSGLIQFGLAGLASLAGGALAGDDDTGLAGLTAVTVTTLTDLPDIPATRAGRTSEPASVSVGRLIVFGAVLLCVMSFIPFGFVMLPISLPARRARRVFTRFQLSFELGLFLKNTRLETSPY